MYACKPHTVDFSGMHFVRATRIFISGTCLINISGFKILAISFQFAKLH